MVFYDVQCVTTGTYCTSHKHNVRPIEHVERSVYNVHQAGQFISLLVKYVLQVQCRPHTYNVRLSRIRPTRTLVFTCTMYVPPSSTMNIYDHTFQCNIQQKWAILLHFRTCWMYISVLYDVRHYHMYICGNVVDEVLPCQIGVLNFINLKFHILILMIFGYVVKETKLWFLCCRIFVETSFVSYGPRNVI